MRLQNPEIKWKSSPIAPRSSDSIPSQLNNVGDGIEGKKTPEQSLPPPSVSLARPGPTPIPGEGGRARERACRADLLRGGVVVPGDRKTRKKLLPLWPGPPPRPPLRPQGAQQTGWRWGLGGRGHSAGTAQVQPGRLGEGALLREGPLKPAGIPGQGGRKTPRESRREYSFLESLFGVIFPPRRG